MIKKGIVFILLVIGVHFNMQAAAIEECDKMIIEGVKAMNRKDHVKSLEILTEARSLAEKNNLYKQVFLALNNIGANYYNMLDYGEALNNYLAAYTIAVKELDEDSEMTVLNNIALLYLKEKQFDKAEEYLTIAYKIARKKKVIVRQGIYAVNLGMVYNEKKDYNTALKFLNEAKSLIREEHELQINVDLALTDNLYYRGEIKEAKKSALSILSSVDENTSKENLVALYLLLSRINEAGNDINTALNYANQALKATYGPEVKIQVYEALSGLYTKAKNYQMALASKDSLINAINEFNNIKNGRQFENNRVKFEIAEYRNKLVQNNEKLKNQGRSFLIILTFAFTIIVLIAWALRNSAIKNKQRKIIHKRTEELLALELEKGKTDKLLLEKQLKEKETLALLEQQKLRNELENRNRKLAAKALHIANRNELIENIINSLSKEPQIVTNQKWSSNIRELKSHLHNDNEWESFLTHFEEVNHNFLKSLREKHPDLNSNDIRFISYVYINLSTKEISLMLNITPEACRKRRERIAKKLGLSENYDLYEYISGL
mgnify:CR=1 FL=1